VTQHTPHEIEYKNVEFEIAEFGISGLQTVLPILLQSRLPLELIIEKLAINPRKVLKIEQILRKAGELANVIMINPNELWIFDNKSNRSKANNNTLFNSELKGKVSLLIHKNKTLIL